MSAAIRCVAETGSGIGESAIWDAADAALWWCDIPAGLIHRYDPATEANETWEFGSRVGCLALREGGGLVVAAEDGLWLFDPATGAREALAHPEADRPANRFNDGTTDRQGRLWAGTMREDGAAAEGSFYRLDPDRSLTRWRGGVTTANGLAFSPDGTRMYFSDSHPSARTIWAAPYDTATGTPGEPNVFFDTRGVAGRPDGGTVDATGCYWMAGVGGWQVYRLSPEGDLLATLDLPVEKPARPAFGGADLDVLYVTTIGQGLTAGTDQPLAGGLFEITGLGVTGLPAPRFAG